MCSRSRISNATVWIEFYVEPLEEKVQRCKANWKEHVSRREGTVYRESRVDISLMNAIVDRLLKG